jgi:hypothetical protein
MMGDLSNEIKENYDMIRALSNDANFDTIIDYLYPNASQYVATEASDDSSIDEAVKSEEVYNLKDEIGSKEDIDLRMNIISRVKQILATIEYTTDEGEMAYVPFNMAYAVLLKIMGNFDTSRNPNEQIKYLDLAINNYGSSPMLSAIKEKLRNLIIDAYPRDLETDIPQFQFKSDSVAVLDTLGQNVRFTSLDTILYNIEKNNDTRYVVYRKRENESQKDFLVRITNDLRNRYASDPDKEVAKLFNISSIVSSYRRFVNLNILANIHTSLVSMRERAPFIAERRYRSGKLVFDYYSVKDSGSNSVYSSQIRESILAKIRSGFIGNVGSRISQAELNQRKQQAQDFRTSSGIFRFGKSLPANPPIAKKIELIKSFIKLIDNRMLNNVIKKNPNAINASDVVYITSLYSGLENLLNVLNTTDLDSDPSELINTLELKFTSLLASKLSNLDEELAPVNYISGDGKGRYKFALSSWGMEVFKKLAVGIDSWIKDGLFAYMDTEFYKRNLFIENRTKILKYFDHDSSKYKGLDTSAVLHKNETPGQWFSRNFNHMFLGALINSNFNNYFQQVFTISDKPNIVGAQVEFIKPNQELSIMRKLVEQEAYRNKQLVGKVKNYTPEKSYLVGVSKAVSLKPDGTLDENDVNRAMDEFERGLQQIAESILDYILNNKVMIHGEIESHMEKFLTSEQMKQWKNDKLFNTTIKTLFDNLRKSKFEESQKASEVDEDSDTNQNEDEFGSDTETGMELLDLNAFKEQSNEKTGEAPLNQTYDQYYAENLANLRRYLAPMARSLAVNFYINSHQLNQMLAGDLAFYKTGTEAYDIIKRLSLVFAPGKSGAVNDTYYLPKETKIAVVEDLKEFITDEEAKESNLPEIAGDNMDTTDAQVYMTPEYYEKLKLAHGTESNQGYILKPVFFGISPEGVPVSVKCSVIVLTDELVDQFPGLAKVRTMLNQKQVDMLAFESAIKMGMPANLTKLFARDEKGKIVTNSDGSLKLVDEELAVPSEIEDESVLTLDTRNFRLQFNPAKKVIGKVTNPSQMTYMGAINEDTVELVDSILERNGKIIKFGRTVVNRTFRLFNGKPTKSKGLTRKIVKNKLISTLANINGSETEADILDNPEASLNLPMIVNKMINNITSVFQKNTVDIKIKGAKLNLQSEFGTFAKSVSANKPRLK